MDQLFSEQNIGLFSWACSSSPLPCLLPTKRTNKSKKNGSGKNGSVGQSEGRSEPDEAAIEGPPKTGHALSPRTFARRSVSHAKLK